MNEPLMMLGLLIAGVIVLLANLALFGLSLKLYTEVMKERSQQRRAEESRQERAA